MIVALRFIHLLSIVFWIGTIAFFSFFAAPSIFKVLPRDTAGDVMSSIFPKYWIVGYVLSVLATATLVALSMIGNTLPTVRIAILVVMTAVTFYSGLVVGAKARDIKAEIRTIESVEEKAVLRTSFKKVHALSAILNMVVFVLGIVLIFIMSKEMVFSP